MAATQLKPRQALNKAFLKVKPNRADMEAFKSALATLFDRVDPAESEEFHKNLLSDLLKHTGFAPDRFINTKGRNDLVIHNGSDTQKAELSDLAEQCAAAKESGDTVALQTLESRIDEIVCGLFGLTEGERAIISNYGSPAIFNTGRET